MSSLAMDSTLALSCLARRPRSGAGRKARLCPAFLTGLSADPAIGRKHENTNSSYYTNKGGEHNSANIPKNAQKFVHVMARKPCSEEPRPTKLKLKLCGVTHTIHAGGAADLGITTSISSGSAQERRRKSHSHELSLYPPRLILQENSEDGERNVFSSRVGNHSEELSWERGLDSQWNSFVDTRMNSYATEVKWESKDSASPPVSVRKSSRIPKKRVLDGDDEEEAPSKQKQYRKAGESDEEQYQVEDELLGDDDDEIEGHSVGKRRKGKKITAAYDLACEAKREVPELASSLVEGLFQSFSNKSKGTLSEAERQLRKEEAARKRRQQSEKAAKEIQAATIEKVLGQNSQRKKREEKLRKQREEWQQERDATAMCPVKSIRWVLGPSGNIVSFSHDIELPKIFSGPCSYPKEREKCAGPACNNVYKYRDSKSNLPLCSLQCYRAIQ